MSISNRRRTCAIRQVLVPVTLAASVAGGAAARAAQVAEPAQQSLEEVIVTATKRDESLQTVPLAVTAVTATALDNMGADNLRDFATSVPSLTFVPTSATTTKIVLRGISTGNNYDAQQSGTGLYLDDVPLASSYGSGGAEIALVDLQRVEVLRGPQGTLYGAGSMGGTVKYVTNQPNVSEFESRVEVEGSRTKGANGELANGVLNVPLVEDVLAVRAVGYYRDYDGYISSPTLGDDAVNSVHIEGGRMALRWEASDTLSLSAFGLYQTTQAGGTLLIDTDTSGRPLGDGLSQTLDVVPTPSFIRSAIGNFVITKQFGAATLTSSSSYIRLRREQYVDDTLASIGRLVSVFIPSNQAVPELFETTETGFVQELRLASEGDGPLEWLGGLFYQDYELDGRRNLTLLPAQGFAALDLVLKTPRKVYAAFGEATYALSDRWSLTAGGRYSRTDNEAFQSTAGLFNNPADPTAVLAATRRGHGSDFTPKLALSFKPSQDQLFYASAAQGYRPGGPNVQYAIVDLPASYDSDTVWSYELGAKTSWLEQRLIANLALFHSDFDKLQVVSANGVLPFIGNSGRARSRGVELELQMRPTSRFTTSLAAAYTDATFRTDAPALSARSGDEIPGVPEWTVSGAIDYGMPLGVAELFAHLDARYVSDAAPATSDAVRTLGLRLDEYTLATARIGARVSGVEVALFVDNLTDERAEYQHVTSYLPSGIRTTIAQPRTVGIHLCWEFP